MPLEVKQFSCPNCGAPLTVRNVGRARSVVCPNCASQIDLTSPEYTIIGNSLRVGPTPRTPLQLGMRGSIEGEVYEIIGRLRYREDEESYWDEWLILNEQGRYRWISDSDDGVRLWDPFTPTEPVDPETVDEDDQIAPEGTAARIMEKGYALIDYIEGELTWKARLGDRSGYIDAAYPGGYYSIEWTPNEIEFYRGRAMSRSELQTAFGITMPASAAVSTGMSPAAVFVILAILLVCIVLSCISSSGSGSGGGFFYIPGGGSGPSIGGGGPSRGGGGTSGGGK